LFLYDLDAWWYVYESLGFSLMYCLVIVTRTLVMIHFVPLSLPGPMMLPALPFYRLSIHVRLSFLQRFCLVLSILLSLFLPCSCLFQWIAGQTRHSHFFSSNSAKIFELADLRGMSLTVRTVPAIINFVSCDLLLLEL
jgi:hypothetical protein